MNKSCWSNTWLSIQFYHSLTILPYNKYYCLLLQFSVCRNWSLKSWWRLTSVEHHYPLKTSSCSLHPSAARWRQASGTSSPRRSSMITDWMRAPSASKDTIIMVSGNVTSWDFTKERLFIHWKQFIIVVFITQQLKWSFWSVLNLTGDPVGLPTRLTLEFSAFDV